MTSILKNQGYSLQRIVDIVLSIIVALVGWFTLYIWALFTALSLAPWDGAPVRPPQGSWQHTVNDFFDGGGGAFLIVGIVFAVELFLYIRTIVRTGSFQNTALVFGIVNIVGISAFIMLGILFFVVADTLMPTAAAPTQYTTNDWQYWGNYNFGRIAIGIAYTLGWWGFLFWFKPRFSKVQVLPDR